MWPGSASCLFNSVFVFGGVFLCDLAAALLMSFNSNCYQTNVTSYFSFNILNVLVITRIHLKIAMETCLLEIGCVI